MKLIESDTHESWKEYLSRGGVLNQSSFIRFQNRYTKVLEDLENRPATLDAYESGSDSGLQKITAQYCAAFLTLKESDLDLSTTDGSGIYWHSNNWSVRESLLLINHPDTL